MQKLTVQSIQKVSFDNEKVIAKNDDLSVIISLHNQELHGKYSEGDELEFDIAETKKAKKTKSAKTK